MDNIETISKKSYGNYMKIVSIVGARPQFIKASAICRSIKEFNKEPKNNIKEVIVHTGQHFYSNMSDIFFKELNIPQPNYNLEISGGSHAEMTSRMMVSIEKVLLKEKPAYVIIYGDTNSTLAAALVAAKIQIPVVHIEAGLRSFNRKMPEEINRIIADRISAINFCPTNEALKNLKNDGLEKNAFVVGDVMYDVSKHFKKIGKTKSSIIEKLNLQNKDFALATCHRAENTDHPERLREILKAFTEINKKMPLFFCIHPRTKKFISKFNLTSYLNNFSVIEPLSFIDMVMLEQAASLILTDSGGVQKEAFFYKTPCITLRDETEWVETVELGWNQVSGANMDEILNAFNNTDIHKNIKQYEPYGDGFSANKIIQIINEQNNK